jgi:Fic family protein
MRNLHAFQPLSPEERVRAPLQVSAAALIAQCHQLSSQASSAVASALRPLLRSMNSYYTNRIEGQHTRPSDIERALRQQFDADVQAARKQRLALAHMAAEAALEQKAREFDGDRLYSAGLVCDIHSELYRRLPEADRLTEDNQPIVPGELRTKDVAAGRHVAPAHAEVPRLLDEWAAHYGKLPGTELRVIGAACAHHRLLWIHPFIDGNGRTARLHTHLVFHALGLTHGLWSPMRGLARTREQYYARLNNADLPRRNDQDGRGALSQEELVAFAAYFLEACLDQVQFMREMLDLPGLGERLRDLLAWLAAHPWQVGSERSTVKLEALEALHYVAIVGPIERQRFVAMTGLGPRTGRRVMASLLDWGILKAASPKGPLELAVPLKALRFLFPRLWPEAESEPAD